MFYLRVEKESFGFVTDEINDIESSDILIDTNVYDKFFKLQEQGKQFKMKDPHGLTFDDIFEEVIPTIDPTPQEPTVHERVDMLEMENAELLFDSAKKDQRIEYLEQDVADVIKEISMMRGV